MVNRIAMGIIKDGSIWGFLPSNEVFAIHYPAYPSSMVRAIETLGGVEGIVKARSSQSNKLELHFRLEDPYSHPAFGELQPCKHYLLKISTQKIRDDENAENSNRLSKGLSVDQINVEQEDCCPDLTETMQEVRQADSDSIPASSEVKMQIPEGVQENLSADIIARVSEAYHFNGMVDYQHVISVHADFARRKKRNWAEVEPHFEKGGLMDVEQEDLMILVPPLFSPKDVPEKVV
ncbi:unnamed protein product [Ilex paraguariensis]|uniref:Transcription factor IIIC subunit Tfc1/Sfc1 triple barrel domain-containing protein n=2 Tax=Ilex paraguariensis TaxID=185542 RepID=A0ABC8UZS9_9AQUA